MVKIFSKKVQIFQNSKNIPQTEKIFQKRVKIFPKKVQIFQKSKNIPKKVKIFQKVKIF